ncbi:Assembly factor cbp4 [Vermiconidia calcicola]|uniref:Assembly factor cbp4 n=1 Tax=Vermiconidia calcicola TaxID=1690605 RepID=A0ACC3NBC3_9PEZI|nr:Assembly factor cbp4 [Vermiconidia calcicola]
MCIGGPALIYYVTPSEEELFLRYNPDLQRRSLENRQQKQEDFDNFVNRLKDYSKSDKPIWVEWEQQAAKKRQEGVQAELDRRKAADAEAEARRQEIKNSLR